MLTLGFRIFAAALAIFGALNILLLVLAEPVKAFFPAGFTPISNMGEAIALFGVGAGVYLVGERKKAH